MSADNKLDRPHVVVAAGGLAFLARGGQTHERIFEVCWDFLFEHQESAILRQIGDMLVRGIRSDARQGLASRVLDDLLERQAAPILPLVIEPGQSQVALLEIRSGSAVEYIGRGRVGGRGSRVWLGN